MAEKCILFMARTTRFHEFARTLTQSLGVEVSLATPDSPNAAHDFDLLMLDGDGIRNDRIDQIAKWLEDRGGIPMLVIVDDETLPSLRLPAHSRSDFICSSTACWIPWRMLFRFSPCSRKGPRRCSVDTL